MTIHASKGLEFPVCYFATMHSKFNISDLNEKFLFDNKYGIISPYFKEGIGKTFVKDLVKENYLKEEISEKIRLLYVALTRPKEKFIIVTSFNDKNISIEKVRSFLDILTCCKDYLLPYIKNVSLDDIHLTKDFNLIKKTNYADIIDKTDEKINIDEISINNQEIHKEKISKETHNLLDKDTREKMKFGTYMHEVLELIDFKNPKIDSIDKYYRDRIMKFIDQIDVTNIINIYKEYEFSYSDGDNIYHGIIDLILEYPESIMIVDYKLKNVDDPNYVKQLNSYKEYISLKTNKKIDIYLFSILSGTFTKVS